MYLYTHSHIHAHKNTNIYFTIGSHARSSINHAKNCKKFRRKLGNFSKKITFTIDCWLLYKLNNDKQFSFNFLLIFQ